MTDSLLLLLIGGMTLLLISGVLSIDLTVFVTLLLAILLGVVDANQAFAGLGSNAVVTIFSTFVLAGALDASGAAERSAKLLAPFVKKSLWRTLICVTLLSIFVSAFINNVAATILLFPAVVSLANVASIPPSKLLIPLTFGVVLGGMITAIGATPNIMIVELMRAQGLAPFKFLDFTPIGMSIALVGGLVLILAARFLLPNRNGIAKRGRARKDLPELYRLHERLFTLRVRKNSPLIGKSLHASRLSELLVMQVVAIRRQAEWLPAPGADFQLESGDVLLVGGRQDDFTKLQKSVGEAGIKLAGLELTASPPPRIESETIGVIEVVVAPRSRLVGKSIVNLKFREHYGYSVLAIWRGGRPYRTNLREMHLKVGDALLLQGPRERFSVLVEDPDFIALGHSPDPKGSVGKTWAAVGALILMLALSVTEVVPTHIAAFSAAIIAVLSGTISLPQAYQGIDWRILFFVAMLIPLGEAFGRSQALVHSAAQIVDYFAALGPTMLLLGIAVIASALSQAIDSIIVVTILAPILIRVAQTQGLSPYPLLMTASLASSIAFLTPFSHKVHLLVMGPGGYRMRDYFRVGLLVTLATMTVLVFGVRYFWNF